MTFTRRKFMYRLPFRLLAGAGAGLAVAGAAEATPEPSGNAVQLVVYHLSEPTRVTFVLGNIRNHIIGKGGPDKVNIVLVVHGPALDFFVSEKTNPGIVQDSAALSKQGVELVACGNTMKAKELVQSDLLAGFAVAEEGGVVRIADLQDQGYVYIRP